MIKELSYTEEIFYNIWMARQTLFRRTSSETGKYFVRQTNVVNLGKKKVNFRNVRLEELIGSARLSGGSDQLSIELAGFLSWPESNVF